jgi:hypothetical protein
LIKTVYFFGTSHTAGGGFEFNSKLKTFNFIEAELKENEEPRGQTLHRIYNELFPNELRTQDNYSFPGQLQLLCNDRQLDIKVVNISKQGYGNERIYRKFYDLIQENEFDRETSLFVFEFSDLERKEIFYNPLQNHVIINYGAVDRYFHTNAVKQKTKNFEKTCQLSSYAHTYWYETDEDLKILKDDYKFFNDFVNKTFDTKTILNQLNINNINFLNFLKNQNFNFLISETHNLLWKNLSEYYDFIDEHRISYQCKDGSILNGFIEYLHKNEHLITYETSYRIADMHPSLKGNKLIAKNIFNECVDRNYIKSEKIKLNKSDFSNPKKSIF